jgi:bifunctional UDP-N-acetylglucosamine pyrophosphorylase/glucosamine-1-phosphate N-acetyltransferase
VILAAGEGTRMKSRRAKVLHEAAGRALCEHVTRAALEAGAARVVVVVGVQADEVRARLLSRFPGEAAAARLLFAEQTERRGTADAVARARAALDGFDGDLLVLCGDVPALDGRALASLLARHRAAGAALTVLSAELPDPAGYGRMVRDGAGALREIVEERDATPDVRAIREINTGTYAADWLKLDAAIREIKPDNAQNEYYLTDAVRLLLARGERAIAVVHPQPDEALGVNSRRQLAEVHAALSRAVLLRLMDAGVTVLDPATTWVHDTVEIGPDTVLYPGVTLEGQTRIGSGCVIRGGSRLTDVTVGDGAEVLDHTVATQSAIGARAHVGPFAHLRPGTVVGEDCKVGNFVETKKTTLGRGSKASHLSYLGDATIGEGVNVGAGTITCNYDGTHKHPTVLEDGVFIGSDTQLVAPVRIGKGAYVGAGTTVTKDVPPGALAISRADQRNIEGWVERRLDKLKKPKGR